MAAMLSLLLVFLISNIGWSGFEVTDATVIRLTLAYTALSVALLALEGGAVFRTTPLERLVGIIYLSIVSLVSAVLLVESTESGLIERSARDLLIISAPLLVHLRLKTLLDLSQEARNFGTMTLIALLFVGLTDSSGGLLAIPVFAIAVQRVTKHVSTPVLDHFQSSPASFFGADPDANGIVWPFLAELTYLGETTDLLFESPRWASILLFSIPAAVAFYIPSEQAREEDRDMGPSNFSTRFSASDGNRLPSSRHQNCTDNDSGSAVICRLEEWGCALVLGISYGMVLGNVATHRLRKFQLSVNQFGFRIGSGWIGRSSPVRTIAARGSTPECRSRSLQPRSRFL